MSDAKLKQFEERLMEERDKLRRGFTITITVYVVIALAVTVYATIVFKGFKELIGPQGLSEQCMSYINMASHAPKKLDEAYQNSKDELADVIVTKALDAIPEVEALAKSQLDSYNNDIKEAIAREVMPNFNAYILETIPELKVRLGELKKTRPDATIGMVLSSAFVEYLDKEVARIIKEDEVIDQANKLHRDLYALQKANKPMTRKELATRKLLISFILISKLDVHGSPLLEEFHKFLEKRFGVTPREIQEDTILEDVSDDHPQEEL